MLIDFCKLHDLVVMNTWFQKWKTKLYTWKSPVYRKLYQIDYVIVKQRFRNSIRDVKTLPGAVYAFVDRSFGKSITSV